MNNGTIGPVTLFGYKVEAHGKFAAIGNPNPQYASQEGTGSIDLYRFNASQGIYTYYGTARLVQEAQVVVVVVVERAVMLLKMDMDCHLICITIFLWSVMNILVDRMMVRHIHIIV